jgi:hypothetical protein
MNKFNNEYSKITSRLFYENIHTLDHNYRIITESKSKSAKDFYNSLIVINSENIELIFESHDDAQFSKALLNKLYNANDFTQIQANEIFDRCSNSIKSKYRIKRNIPMYIFNFSFSKNSKMISTIFHAFKIPFTLQNGTLKKKYDYESNFFKNAYKNAGGLCSDQGEYILIIFNKDKINETIINHEIYHYLQLILEKSETINIENSKFNEIKELQLSIEDQEYLFDKWEFETHIKVDLINQLDEMYWNFYKNISKVEFIEKFINAVEKNPLNVVSNFISLLLKMKNNDTTSLRLFAACYIIKDKEYLLRAINWLKECFVGRR